MGARGKSVVAVGAVALAALAIWLWPRDEGTAAPPLSSTPLTVPAAAVANASTKRSVEVPTSPPAEAPAGERAPTAAPRPSSPLARADEIVVRVVDADSGSPVLAYGLREHVSRTASSLLHAGPHADGRLVLPEAELDRRVFSIEDAAGRYLPSRWFAAGDAVERDGERSIEVRLPGPVDVRVKVVRERGGEVRAGTRVELMRPWVVPDEIPSRTGSAPDYCFRMEPYYDARTMKLARGTLASDQARLLGDVVTDAAGIAVLRVPRGERLALRLTGALHRTRIVEPWQAPEPTAEVVLTIPGGAAVRGRVTPLWVLEQLHELPSELLGASPAKAQGSTIGVWLRHQATGEVRPPEVPGRALGALDFGGSFEVEGLAPGTWQLFVRYALNVERGEPRRPVSPRTFVVEMPKLEGLAEGELRVVDVDVTDWEPGTLVAQLPRDDRMGKDGDLWLRQIASVGPPLVVEGSVSVGAAPGERIDVRLPPARYLAQWRRAGTANLLLGELEVRPRETTTVALAIDAETASIHVREADGSTPVRGELVLRRAGWSAVIDVDANGAATFDAMPRGSELQATFRRRDAQQPSGPSTEPIDVGTLRADGKPIVLRLPPR